MKKNLQEIWDNRFAEFLLDSMAEGVFTLDAKGRITSWNPAMERMTGYTVNEAVGQSCRILSFSGCLDGLCPGDPGSCGIFEKGGIEPKECRFQHKDGQFVSVIKTARVVKDETGAAIGVVETLTDLTELISAKQKIKEAEQKLVERHQFGNIIGKSRAMVEVFEAITVASRSDATVLIQGESGTGKELVAGAIHYNSDRYQKPLITVSCSALPESLLESELFGHVKGSFTGAHRDRKGRFEEADGGSIFLDEIGDISPFIQLKLLRAIQERQIERVGESKQKNIDIRIIAATHKDLYSLVKEGRFREDLYYRLKVFPVYLPPLRERRQDIPLLIEHFISAFNKKTGKKIKGVSPEALRMLMDYEWPGNVRELENAVEHAFVLCSNTEIGIFDLPVEIRQMRFRVISSENPGGFNPIAKKPTRSILIDLLNTCDWNKAEVARRLGRSRTSVWKYMKKWKIPLTRPDE